MASWTFNADCSGVSMSFGQFTDFKWNVKNNRVQITMHKETKPWEYKTEDNKLYIRRDQSEAVWPTAFVRQ